MQLIIMHFCRMFPIAIQMRIQRIGLENYSDPSRGIFIVRFHGFYKINWPCKLNFIIRSDSNHREHECDSWWTNSIGMTPEVTNYHEGQVKVIQYWYLSAICVQKWNFPIIIIQGRPTTNSLSSKISPIGRPRSSMLILTLSQCWKQVFWPSKTFLLDQRQRLSICCRSRTQNDIILFWLLRIESWKRILIGQKTKIFKPCQDKHGYN